MDFASFVHFRCGRERSVAAFSCLRQGAPEDIAGTGISACGIGFIHPRLSRVFECGLNALTPSFEFGL
jgi:hypothetical protein